MAELARQSPSSLSSSPCGCKAAAAKAPAVLKVVGTGRDFGSVARLGYAPKRSRLEGRQLEVAQLVALGLADKEIAHFLDVSQGTVKGHVSAILRTLGLYRRTQICRFIHEAGLFPPE